MTDHTDVSETTMTQAPAPGGNADYATLTYEVADGIATVTLNRPEELNSFTVQMAHDLIDVWGRVSADEAVGAAILTGAGRGFCAGMNLNAEGNVFGLDSTLRPTPADLADERLEDPQVRDGLRDTGGRVSLAMYACTKPIIVAINGPAVGIGATMTLPADFRLASTKARIGFVFSRLGIVPEACSSWFLPRAVGMQQALEWVYSGDILTADEALAGGLLRSVHEPEDLLPAARELAARVSRGKSRVGIALTRQMMWRNAAQPHPIEAHRADSLAMWHTSEGDGKEGVRAFLEKRAPEFTSRVPQDLPHVFPHD